MLFLMEEETMSTQDGQDFKNQSRRRFPYNALGNHYPLTPYDKIRKNTITK